VLQTVNSTQPFVALNYALNVDRDFHAVPWRTLEGTVFEKHYRPAFPHHHFGKTSASFMSKRASALIDNFRMWHAPAETDQLGLTEKTRRSRPMEPHVGFPRFAGWNSTIHHRGGPESFWKELNLL
jgi:hypothetical protein